MSNVETTTPCQLCGFQSDDYRAFVSGYAHTFICADSNACLRRSKRNAVIAEMQEMAKKPHIHPVDKFSRISIATCGFFFGCVITIGLAYLWFGI